MGHTKYVKKLHLHILKLETLQTAKSNNILIDNCKICYVGKIRKFIQKGDFLHTCRLNKKLMTEGFLKYTGRPQIILLVKYQIPINKLKLFQIYLSNLYQLIKRVWLFAKVQAI